MNETGFPYVMSPPTDLSSPNVDSQGLLISVTAMPLNLVLRGYVVKNGTKWVLILARRRLNEEAYELLSKFVGEFVSVHVVDLGIHITMPLQKRGGEYYIYINIPSRVRKFFEPAWRNDKNLTVIITIDPRLLRNSTQR
jgi:hypothetical protein